MITNKELQLLKYPIGRFVNGTRADTPERVAACIASIAALPQKLRAEVAGLSDAQLDTRYRPGGWTVRQVVHHLADGHMIEFIRVKLALTEDRPVVAPYAEARWAELADSGLPVEVSLNMLATVHERSVALLKRLSSDDLQRGYFHPEWGREVSLAEALELYAWHGEHHLLHIIRLKERGFK